VLWGGESARAVPGAAVINRTTTHIQRIEESIMTTASHAGRAIRVPSYVLSIDEKRRNPRKIELKNANRTNRSRQVFPSSLADQQADGAALCKEQKHPFPSRIPMIVPQRG